MRGDGRPDRVGAREIRAATFTVEAIVEREKVTDHDTAAFVDVLAASAGPAGRWIHYGLTSSDVLDTGLALQLRRVARGRAARVTRAGEGADRARLRARRHPLRRAHPWHPRGADDVRGQARGLRVRGVSQRRAARRAPLPRRASARSRAPSGRTRRPRRISRSGCWRGSASPASRCRRRSWRAIATPSCSRRSRSPAPGIERFATEIRNLARTEVSEVRSRSRPARRDRARCRTSATRSAPSRSSGSRGCSAATPWPGSRTWRCGTSATSRTRRSSGSSCPTRRSCSTTCSGARSRWSRGWSSTPSGCGPTSS